MINWFDDFEGKNEYRFLSNFYVGVPLSKGGTQTFQTGEHLFAALKAETKEDYEKIKNAKTPQAAKTLGRRCKLRPDWELIKYDVMRLVIMIKFAPGTALAGRLVETGDALLVEGTFWNDRVWGIDLRSGRGRNWLGVILMAQRAALRSGHWHAVPGIEAQLRATCLPLWFTN